MIENKRAQESIYVSKLKLEHEDTEYTDILLDLAESIRNYGILIPLIVVGPDENGKYTIIDGASRYNALKMINDNAAAKAECIKAVPCHIVDDGQDNQRVNEIKEQLLYAAVIDNNKRESQRIKAVEMLCERSQNGEIEPSDLSQYIQQYLGVNERYARMYRAVFTTGIPELRDAVKYNKGIIQQRRRLSAGQKSATVHIAIHFASRIATYDPEVQKRILDRINAGEKVGIVLKEFSESRKKTSIK